MAWPFPWAGTMASASPSPPLIARGMVILVQPWHQISHWSHEEMRSARFCWPEPFPHRCPSVRVGHLPDAGILLSVHRCQSRNRSLPRGWTLCVWQWARGPATGRPLPPPPHALQRLGLQS